MSQQEQTALQAVKVTGSFSTQSAGANLSGDEGLIGGFIDKVLGGVSATRRICLDGSKPQPVRILPAVNMTECFDIDSNSWTYNELGGKATAVAEAAMAGAGSVLGWIGW
jgi:hypothetical protein